MERGGGYDWRRCRDTVTIPCVWPMPCFLSGMSIRPSLKSCIVHGVKVEVDNLVYALIRSESKALISVPVRGESIFLRYIER